MAKYIITHPIEGCNTVFHGLRFVDGKAELDTNNSSLVAAFVKADGAPMEEAEILDVLKRDGCEAQPDSQGAVPVDVVPEAVIVDPATMQEENEEEG
jgi:hypothetical protein